MESNKYNGWTNYETWVVKLWIDNDQGTQEYWLDMAREINAATPEGKEPEFYALAESLKDSFNENSPLDGASVYTDLLNAALSEVDWHEIAVALIEDAVEIGE